jgi:NAD(P)-dependent dehydrogenase (short-subunit alcohol dehydrogenase family)
MTTTLITGANKGLGYETARRLVAEGHDVWITARDPELGDAAAKSLGARFVTLDVTDEASMAGAADVVAQSGGLDVLINNAGIVGPRPRVPETTAEDVRITYETNVFGPVRALRAFSSILDASAAPVVVNVSSGVGSLGYASDPSGPAADILLLGYSSSKAALNMLTIKWARAHPRWRVNAADPGFTATDLNDRRGTQTVQEGPTRSSASRVSVPTGRPVRSRRADRYVRRPPRRRSLVNEHLLPRDEKAVALRERRSPRQLRRET